MISLTILAALAAFGLGYFLGRKQLLEAQKAKLEKDIQLLATCFNLTPEPGEAFQHFEHRIKDTLDKPRGIAAWIPNESNSLPK